MNMNTLKNKLSTFCLNETYYLFFLILAFLKFSPNISFPVQICLVLISLLFWSIKYFRTDYSKKEHVLNILLIVLTIISIFTAKREALFLSMLAVVGLKDIDVRKLIKSFIIIGSLTLIISIIFYLIFNAGADINTRPRYILGIPLYITKYSFGYNHANYTFLLVYTLVVAYMYLKFEKLKIKHYILLTLIISIAFFFTFSRTGFIVYIFTLLLVIFLKSNLCNNPFFNWLMKHIPSFTIILSFLLPVVHRLNPTGAIEMLNKTLQGRIYLSHEFWTFFKPNLFGQNVDDISKYSGYYLKCDNSFVSILCAYGIVVFILFLFMTLRMERYSFSKPKLMLISSFYVYGFAENFFTVAFLNLSFICLCELMYKNSVVNRFSFESVTRRSLNLRKRKRK